MSARFREARREDLPRLVELLADDPLGATRESAGPQLHEDYERAFAEIDADPGELLLVAERDGLVVGLLQLSIVPSLTRRGARRAQVEGVRVAREARGEGLGRALLEEALRFARERGCRLVQLTTDKQRPEALRFYEGLGFVASHEGLKLALD